MTDTNAPNSPGPRYAKPELHFVTKQVSIGDPELGIKSSVSQLVRKDAVLADFPDYQRLKKRGFLRSPIEAGDNVVFDEEAYTLIAGISGYPKAVTVKQQEGPDILLVSITPVIKIAHDRMQANIVIHPAIPDLPSLKTIDINQLVEEAGVVYGIIPEALEKAFKSIHAEYVDFDDIVIAKGIYPGEGEDAYLQFDLEIGPLAGHMLEDGSIDFRERKIMVGVKDGQRLATKIPAVPGEEGYNVLGEEIEPKTGKDIKVRIQGDARFDSDTNLVTATKDGAMSVVNKKIIKVSSKTTIQGDINYKTGNLESENNTTIRGNIQPGFKVRVGGDLEIGGSISSAEIRCTGNAVIKGGITGQNTLIEAEGDIDINFIERATMRAGGITVIRKQAYYSTIESHGDIRCAKTCAIMGGVLMAGGNLTVGNVGAENCEPSTLAAGIDPERYKLYLELKTDHLRRQEEIIQAMQMLGPGGRSRKLRKMEEEADELKMQLMKLNLIPGTELYSRIGSGNSREDLDDEDPLYNQGADIEKLRIEVVGKVYAGTTIMLGNRSAKLSEDVSRRRYRLSKNLKRIMAIPL